METNLNYLLNFIFSNIEYILASLSAIPVIYYLIKRKFNEIILYPDKKFKFEKSDLKKINLKLIVFSNSDILESILFNLRKIYNNQPIWVKIKKYELGFSDILNSSKQLYSISLIGKKEIIKDFFQAFKNEILKENLIFENKNSLDKLEMEDLNENVKLKNLEINNSNWFIKLFLVIFALITIILIVIRYSKKRMSEEEAINLASEYLEKIEGQKPKIINSYFSNGKYYVFTNKHSLVLGRNGKMIELKKNE